MRIDYDSLDFPGPELASLAMQANSGDAALPHRSPSQAHLELATFAGGCFWGLELAFQRQEGVVYTMVGYTQGREVAPTYEQVGAGNTGHTEAVCIYFDPSIVTYSTLLNLFFQRVDPTTVNGQGRDFGSMYRTGIYYHSEEQKNLAHSAMAQQQARYKSTTGRPLATECKQATAFWPAEGYHQQYLAKGGRFGEPQSAEKNCQDEIRCYG